MREGKRKRLLAEICSLAVLGTLISACVTTEPSISIDGSSYISSGTPSSSGSDSSGSEGGTEQPGAYIEILGDDVIELKVFDTYQIQIECRGLTEDISWYSDDTDVIEVDDEGNVEAVWAGTAEVYVTSGTLFDSVTVTVAEPRTNPYRNVNKSYFYANYHRARSFTDATFRNEVNLMSGELETPDQEPTISSYQPMEDGKFIHNSGLNFSDNGETYTVVDSYGEEAFEIYRDGAYVTLEEVAAYIYAFGDVPANYDENKDNKNASRSEWKEYLRLNNSEFSGDTRNYPYEPELPRIAGIGGDLVYYEIDIGTTGTDCDPKYDAVLYNDGNEIVRGAARIVYSRFYEDNERPVAPEDRYVFYTYNHYNDFQEYLNYVGGWGEMFGNITGGGKISSKSDYNPTPYVETVRMPLD